MSLLEEKVDSAVASHERAEVARVSAVEVTASQSQPCAEEPPSTAASASDGMEEIDTGAPVPGPTGSREGVQTVSSQNSPYLCSHVSNCTCLTTCPK